MGNLDIINHILNGAIVKAIEALNTHYPDVLSHSGITSSANTSGSNGTNGHHSNGLSSAQSSHPWAVNQSPSLITSSNGNGTSTNGASTSNGNGNGYTNGSNGRPQPTIEPINHALPTFPTSSYPAHILLNLHIQQFIESFRLLNPSDSNSASSSMTSSITSLHASQSLSLGTGTGSLQHALTAAGGLHAEAGKLEPSDRAVYVREITEAGAMFAYSDPDSSPVGGFLKQERRISLASQVNKAILSESTNLSFLHPVTPLHNYRSSPSILHTPPRFHRLTTSVVER